MVVQGLKSNWGGNQNPEIIQGGELGAGLEVVWGRRNALEKSRGALQCIAIIDWGRFESSQETF